MYIFAMIYSSSLFDNIEIQSDFLGATKFSFANQSLCVKPKSTPN